jgi:hypothetical protein
MNFLRYISSMYLPRDLLGSWKVEEQRECPAVQHEQHLLGHGMLNVTLAL